MASTLNILLFVTVLLAAAAFSTSVSRGIPAPAPAPNQLAGGIDEATLRMIHAEGLLPKGLWRRLHRDENLIKAIEAGAPLPPQYERTLAKLLRRESPEPEDGTDSPESTVQVGPYTFKISNLVQ